MRLDRPPVVLHLLIPFYEEEKRENLATSVTFITQPAHVTWKMCTDGGLDLQNTEYQRKQRNERNVENTYFEFA